MKSAASILVLFSLALQAEEGGLPHVDRLEQALGSEVFADFVDCWDPESMMGKMLLRSGDRGWGRWDYKPKIAISDREVLFADDEIQIIRCRIDHEYYGLEDGSLIKHERRRTLLAYKIHEDGKKLWQMTDLEKKMLPIADK